MQKKQSKKKGGGAPPPPAPSNSKTSSASKAQSWIPLKLKSDHFPESEEQIPPFRLQKNQTQNDIKHPFVKQLQKNYRRLRKKVQKIIATNRKLQDKGGKESELNSDQIQMIKSGSKVYKELFETFHLNEMYQESVFNSGLIIQVLSEEEQLQANKHKFQDQVVKKEQQYQGLEDESKQKNEDQSEEVLNEEDIRNDERINTLKQTISQFVNLMLANSSYQTIANCVSLIEFQRNQNDDYYFNLLQQFFFQRTPDSIRLQYGKVDNMKTQLERWLFELFTDSNKPLHSQGSYNYSDVRQFINRLAQYTETKFMNLAVHPQQYIVYQKKQEKYQQDQQEKQQQQKQQEAQPKQQTTNEGDLLEKTQRQESDSQKQQVVSLVENTIEDGQEMNTEMEAEGIRNWHITNPEDLQEEEAEFAQLDQQQAQQEYKEEQSPSDLQNQPQLIDTSTAPPAQGGYYPQSYAHGGRYYPGKYRQQHRYHQNSRGFKKQYRGGGRGFRKKYYDQGYDQKANKQEQPYSEDQDDDEEEQESQKGPKIAKFVDQEGYTIQESRVQRRTKLQNPYEYRQYGSSGYQNRKFQEGSYNDQPHFRGKRGYRGGQGYRNYRGGGRGFNRGNRGGGGQYSNNYRGNYRGGYGRGRGDNYKKHYYYQQQGNFREGNDQWVRRGQQQQQNFNESQQQKEE